MKTTQPTLLSLTFLIVLCALPSLASAQRLARLMEERAGLYDEWEYYQDQNNAFFGGKSKDDLSNIIGVQQGIIAKDNEILEEVKAMNISTQKGLRSELEATQSQLESANNTIGDLKTELENTTELYNDSLSEAASESSFKNTAFISMLALLGVTAYLGYKLKKAKAGHLALSAQSLTGKISYDADDYIAKLEKIGKLKANGLITEDDYTLQKDKILAAI